MGEVYRARDIRLDRTVAIKILPPAVAGDPQFRERYQVSTDSAVAPRWRGDGRELFYLEAAATHAARQMIAVDVGAHAGSFDRGASHSLFLSDASVFQRPPGSGPYQRSAVSRDDERFLISRPVGSMTTADDQASAPVAVVLNWAAAFK